MGKNEVVILNLTGSGIETDAHLRLNGRLTVIFALLRTNPEFSACLVNRR
jgi:hypothetical protein